ncbi:VWA domain-containing protein [Microbacterium sp. Mu-80]|uniref:VWA domain-containing protein n=1 Tax=Microbacterium bandirmense TaxID=3122050 RepID=A0ABU8LF10_9MICO
MIVQPVLHPLLLVLLCAPLVALAVWALVRAPSATHAGRDIWALRLGMVVVVFAMLLRPGIPGGTSQTLATDTDIVIAVDTTASMVAEDWNGDEPRLNGVRADVQAIVDEYPGARFALISFDAAAQLRLPLTTDATALMSSLEVMSPEVTDQSRGSSIGIANRMLAETLSAAASAAPERSRMVFYLGDGEQTVTSEPESLAAAAKFVDGGAVLGYGSAEGGPMRITTGRPSTGSSPSTGSGTDAGYIEYQGAPAMSVRDDDNLRQISEQLGVEYQPRAVDAELALPEAPATTTDYSSSGEVGNVIELYWILALVLLVLVAIEVGRATMQVVRLRALARPSSRRSASRSGTGIPPVPERAQRDEGPLRGGAPR